MPQNVPQCPISNDHHDIPSPAHPSLTPAAPPDPPLGSGGLSRVASSRPLPDDAPPPAPLDSSLNNHHSSPGTPGSPLPTLQLAAIDLLVLGHKDTAVAAALGVDRKTLYRWRHHDPRFRDELDRRRKDLLDHTADRFRTLLTDALDTFARHLKDPYAPTAHRAARALLALAAIGKPRHPSPLPPSQPLTRDKGQMTTPPS